jgi:hypothetical protein
MQPQGSSDRSLSGAVKSKTLLQLTGICLGLALLTACAGSGTGADGGLSTNYYISHAAGNYRPPGTAGDPWGPYIKIAASRFDVPEQWVRMVMRAESGGQQYIDGQLTVSTAGAMGLMQLEPETYQEMANRYGLGSDPFNPYDNIMAGTAYIHEMYSVYGSPGFLAAYNAGPGRLDSYMNGHRPLPAETTNYVAMIAPKIQGYYPSHRSEADQLAMNNLPASNSAGFLSGGISPGRDPAPESPGNPAPPQQLVAMLPPAAPESAVYSPEPARRQTVTPPPPRPGFSLISSAMADTPVRQSNADELQGRGWAIQVGAYKTRGNANAALGIAELSAVQILMHGQPIVLSTQAGSHTKYRARFVGLAHNAAIDACERLSAGPTGCVILSPEAQS